MRALSALRTAFLRRLFIIIECVSVSNATQALEHKAVHEPIALLASSLSRFASPH